MIHESLSHCDAIDSMVHRALAKTEDRVGEDSELIYYLLSRLLGRLNDEMLGDIFERAADELAHRGLGGLVHEMEELADDCRNLLDLLVPDRTYSALSYWSPFDGKRRTIAHRAKFGADDDAKQSLAAAYAFYALTHFGAGEPHKLHSITQFVATRAVTKVPFVVDYRKDPGATQSRWLHLPAELTNDFFATMEVGPRLLEPIGNYLKTTTSLEELQVKLGCALRRGGDWSWPEVVDIESFFDDCMTSSQISRLGKESQALVQQLRYFADRELKTNVTKAEAAFMIMTHFLYNCACPTQLIYTFPVRVRDTCCVMTLGTEEPLNDTAATAAARIASSVFGHALIRDYYNLHYNKENVFKAYEHSVAQKTTETVRSGGIEVARRVRPCSRLGGDVAAVSVLRTGGCRAMLIDVAGHGLSTVFGAAWMMGFIKIGDKFLSQQTNYSIVRRINDYIYKQGTPDRGATSGRAMQSETCDMIAVDFASDGSFAKILGGGMAQVLHYRERHDRWDTVELNGTILGAVSNDEFSKYFRNVKVALEPGDMLVCVSDGAFEWASRLDKESRVQTKGVEWLENTLSNTKWNNGDTALAFAKRLEATILEEREACSYIKELDDVTVIVARRIGGGDGISTK